MKEERNKLESRQRESGAALLIAIFALMLISVVAIALIVSQGTDSALAGNYRTSTSAYYAAVAGLEEARGRLLWKNPDYFDGATSPNPSFMPMSGVLPAMQVTDVRYILNPAGAENVDPTSADPANYPDTEYAQEFPAWGLGGATVVPINSTFQSAAMPGPVYKWVRINPVTEFALQLDVNNDGVIERTTALLYDPANVDASYNPRPGLVFPTIPPTPTAVQALELTALAVMPSGSRRMLQYVVAPLLISTQPANSPPSTPPFPAALTLDGNGVIFRDAGSAGYKIDGRDACSSTTPQAAVNSIAYTNPDDYSVSSTPISPQVIPPSKNSHYPGYPMVLAGPPPGSYVPTTPSVAPTPTQLRQSWETPATLDAVAQDITKSADVVINGPTNGAAISTSAPMMSPSNPMTIVVNGDLNLNGWHGFGYGLLLVTGTLKYDPDANWNGLVLVIGQGVYSSSLNGSGGIMGAVLMAKTRDSSGNLLPGNSLGAACFGSQSSCTGFGGGYGSNPGFGIIYNSCSVSSAQGPLTYKVLSFREIPTN